MNMAMYNKFITFLVLTFIVSISFAQQYTPMTAAGYQYKRAKVDSTLHIPSFCGVPTLRNSTAIQGAIAMDTCANKLYQWTNAAGWSIISGAGGGGGGTLQSVTDSGNTTTNDIQLLNHARVILGDSGEVLLDNGSKLKMGAIDAQTGGSKGIAMICAVGYEMKWEGGSLYIMNDQGLTVREVRYKFSSIPTTTDDGSKGFYPGSRWVLDNGQLYVCSDSTSGAAVWQNATYPSLQDVATVGNIYNNDYATIELNKYQYVDGSNNDRYFPFYFTGTQDFGGDVAFIGFTDNRAELNISRPGINSRVVSINSEGINLFQNDELTENQSEISINQNGLMINDNGNTGTILNYVSSNNSQFYDVHMPFQNGSANDTLATLNNIRNSAIDTANKWVNNIYRTSGVDSIYYKIGSTTYAIKDSVGNGGGGGGGGKIYYFNGGVNLGTFGGITMYELGDTAITGTAANFTRATTGNIANFITDVNKPGLLQIPAGVWTIDAFLSETGGGSNHAQIYALLEKWNGSTITTIATSPVEEITNGSSIDLYTYAISVPTTTLSSTDRIIIQFYIQNTNGKTVTLYTQNGYVGEVHTTFTTGIGALNGLTASTQTFATGTSGTDFNISSATSTHTFNLPTASATNRGALSSANWSTFNSKLGASDTVSLSNRINLKVNIADTSSMLTPYLRSNTASATYLAKSDSTTYYTKYRSDTSRTNIYNALLGKQGTITLTTTGTSGASTLVGNTLNIPQYSGGTSYTFSTGLTNSSGTVTSNLSTGVSGGQSVVGGTAASNSLTLSSTTNATKGKILFGTSAYDEVNNRLGIGTASPTEPLHIRTAGTGLNFRTNFTVENTNTSGAASMQFINGNGRNAFVQYTGSTYAIGEGLGIFTESDMPVNFFSNGSTLSGGTSYIGFSPGGYANESVRFFGSKNVGFNTTTDAGYRIDVNGTARVQGALNFNPTNTASGTTGNRTINKTSGTVNIAAAGTTVTVTNNLVTTSSIVYAVIRTNDATATIKNVVPGAGSFVINLGAAATAEVSIGFFVIN